MVNLDNSLRDVIDVAPRHLRMIVSQAFWHISLFTVVLGPDLHTDYVSPHFIGAPNR